MTMLGNRAMAMAGTVRVKADDPRPDDASGGTLGEPRLLPGLVRRPRLGGEDRTDEPQQGDEDADYPQQGMALLEGDQADGEQTADVERRQDAPKYPLQPSHV